MQMCGVWRHKSSQKSNFATSNKKTKKKEIKYIKKIRNIKKKRQKPEKEEEKFLDKIKI